MHLIKIKDPPPPHTHTHTHGRNSLDERSAHRRDLCLTTHSTHKGQTSVPSTGFETAIPSNEQPQTHVLVPMATGPAKHYLLILLLLLLLLLLPSTSSSKHVVQYLLKMNGTLTIPSLAMVYPNNSSIHSVPIKHALHCQLLLPYDIYLLQLGFQLVAVVGKLLKNGKWTAIYTKGEIIRKTIQKHRIHKIENKHKKRKNIKTI